MSIRIATSLAVALCALPLLAHGEDGEGSDSLAYKANEQAARPLAPRGPTTVEEMEAFVDGFMDAQMKSGPIAGAAVVVVKDGQVFFQKGYGYEDTEKRTPVDPAQTLFRPGSVSKLFTWTAIMQLVEQGKIDLDADVNTYLKDFKVDATYPRAGEGAQHHDAHGRLRGRRRRLPVRRTRPKICCRSANGWLRTSRRAFGRRRPTSATARTPRIRTGPRRWAATSSRSFRASRSTSTSSSTSSSRSAWSAAPSASRCRSRWRRACPAATASKQARSRSHGFEFIHAAGPAGSMTSTVADMARFMLAHLQDGALGDAHILKPETAQLMHKRVMSPDAALNGHALGFYETYINGRRIIGHGGDTQYFHSVLSLMPETGIGLFATVNTGGQWRQHLGRARACFLQALLSRGAAGRSSRPLTLPSATRVTPAATAPCVTRTRSSRRCSPRSATTRSRRCRTARC